MQDSDWSQSISKHTWSKPLLLQQEGGGRFVVEDDADTDITEGKEEKIRCWRCLRRCVYFKMKSI